MSGSMRAKRLGRCVLMLLAAFGMGGTQARAAYVLAPGDTIEVSVLGAPELKTKATVDVDGLVRLPLTGPLKAGGMTVDELQNALREKIPQQGYRQRTGDGHDTVTVFDANEITVQIADYRPVYVRGDVSRPGEQVFRPGLTVRQVIALAGGYDLTRFHVSNPFLEASDLRAEYEQLWTDFARQQVRAALIGAILDGHAPPDLLNAVKAPIATSLMSDIVRNESEQVGLQNADYERQLAYLEHSASTASDQAATLLKPRADAEESQRDESEYTRRLSQLMDKGVIAHAQVADQTRATLDSSQRFLTYSSQIAELTRIAADFRRQAQHLTDEHRSQLLKDRQDCTIQIANLQAKLQAIGEKLLYTGALSSQMLRGSASKPDIRIIHSGANGLEDHANEDSVLAAGDVVDVALQAALPTPGVIN